MKLLFLRGAVDERTQRVTRLSDNTDMWTHLAAALGDDVKILYQGGHRKVYYADNVCEEWVHSFKYCHINFKPDVVFARGGFDYYKHMLKAFPSAYKIYCGAGIRTHPKDGIKYNLTIVDDERDFHNANTQMVWNKPAAPHFYPRNKVVTYDVCFVANGQQAKIKRVKWVYKTVPPRIRVLHLGYPSRYTPPTNVTCKRVGRSEMPEWICKCKVGIAPYSSYDSGPRAVSEMMACGLDVVSTPDTRTMLTLKWDKKSFWDCVSALIDKRTDIHESCFPWSIEKAADEIRNRIG